MKQTKINRLSSSTDSFSRRQFFLSLAALAVPASLGGQGSPVRGTYGITYTSFALRRRQIKQRMGREGPALPAEKFVDLCKSFGGDGCQMEVSQLTSTDSSYLRKVRSAAERKGMFIEFSVGSQVLHDEQALAELASTAQQLGASRLRAALSDKTRYEGFADLEEWKSYVNSWQQKLQQAEPILRQHGLLLGVENNGEWMAGELAEMLRSISSPHLGACVDFGNNLALLEDPLEVVAKLAPFVVTAHLKDVALDRFEEGLRISEVPLGEGILPLAKMMEGLRGGRQDVHFCLEIVTRDPIEVPYQLDFYWASQSRRDQGRIGKFEKLLLSQPPSRPLPRISILRSAQMLAIENANIRRSTAYAKRSLGL